MTDINNDLIQPQTLQQPEMEETKTDSAHSDFDKSMETTADSAPAAPTTEEYVEETNDGPASEKPEAEESSERQSIHSSKNERSGKAGKAGKGGKAGKAGKGGKAGKAGKGGNVEGGGEVEGGTTVPEDATTEELIDIAATSSDPAVIDQILSNPNTNSDVLLALANNEMLAGDAIPAIVASGASQLGEVLADPDLSPDAQVLFLQEIATTDSPEALASIVDSGILNDYSYGEGENDQFLGNLGLAVASNPNASDETLVSVMASPVGSIPEVLAAAVSNPNASAETLDTVAEVYFTGPDAVFNDANHVNIPGVKEIFDALVEQENLTSDTLEKLLSSTIGETLAAIGNIPMPDIENVGSGDEPPVDGVGQVEYYGSDTSVPSAGASDGAGAGSGGSSGSKK